MNLGNVLTLLSLFLWIANIGFVHGLIFVKHRLQSEILSRKVLIILKPGFNEYAEITEIISYFPGKFNLKIIKPVENLKRLTETNPELSERVKLVGIEIVPASIVIEPKGYWTERLWSNLMNYVSEIPSVERLTVLNENRALTDFLLQVKSGLWFCLVFFISIAFASLVVGLSVYKRMTRFLILIFMTIGLLAIDYLIWRQGGEVQRWGLVIPFIAFISGLLGLLPSHQEVETRAVPSDQLE